MTHIFESTIEEFVIELLQKEGWEYLSFEDQEAERPDFAKVNVRYC